MQKPTSSRYQATAPRAILGIVAGGVLLACLFALFGAISISDWQSDQPKNLREYLEALVNFPFVGSLFFTAPFVVVGLSCWTGAIRFGSPEWKSAAVIGFCTSFLIGLFWTLFLNGDRFKATFLIPGLLVGLVGALASLASWRVAYRRRA